MQLCTIVSLRLRYCTILHIILFLVQPVYVFLCKRIYELFELRYKIRFNRCIFDMANYEIETRQNHIPLPNLPLNATENNDVDVNGNVIPAVQIMRRNPDPRRLCTSDSKIKLTVFFCFFELILSALYLWIYFSVTDSSLPKTFAWKQLHRYFYFDIKNSTYDCRHIRKAVPLKRETGIRPNLNREDFCVIDKHLRICPYEVTKHWYSVPTLPFLTLVLPIIMVIMTVVHVYTRYRYARQDAPARFACPIYMISFLCPLLFLFGWLIQFIQHMVGDELKADMFYGYDMMNPNSLSHQWELTQSTSHCCGFHSYHDWNISSQYGRYPQSCCNTELFPCTEAPTKDEVWNRGCFLKEKNRFSFTAGVFLVLLLFKTILEFGITCFLVDIRVEEMQENSSIHCTNFGARAFGVIEITDVVTENTIIATIQNFRSNWVHTAVERSFHYVQLNVHRRGVIKGSVHIIPTHGLTVDDIIIHFDQSHRGIFEITTAIRTDEHNENEIVIID